ncbi:hypothetical protein LDENG_00130120 [Lucifuga dentata]|nr:hypothetical protein LDENG_00130120 [Lucifuga dentata]
MAVSGQILLSIQQHLVQTVQPAPGPPVIAPTPSPSVTAPTLSFAPEPHLSPPERYDGHPGCCQAFLTMCSLTFELQSQTYNKDELASRELPADLDSLVSLTICIDNGLTERKKEKAAVSAMSIHQCYPNSGTRSEVAAGGNLRSSSPRPDSDELILAASDNPDLMGVPPEYAEL